MIRVGVYIMQTVDWLEEVGVSQCLILIGW